MSERIKLLIEQIVTQARARGLTQAKLAERAGMTPVGLSKAKHRGDIRASTLQSLCSQVDLELVAIPRQSSQQAAQAIKAGTFFRLSDETDSQG